MSYQCVNLTPMTPSRGELILDVIVANKPVRSKLAGSVLEILTCVQSVSAMPLELRKRKMDIVFFDAQSLDVVDPVYRETGLRQASQIQADSLYMGKLRYTFNFHIPAVYFMMAICLFESCVQACS